MKVIIVGAGRMGFSLAQQLDQEGHEVFVIDPDAKRVEMAKTRLDVMAIQGSGASMRVLRELNVSGADLLIAASGSDEVNIVACLIAREQGVQRRIARVESYAFMEDLREVHQDVLGVDEFINPRLITVDRLFEMVLTPGTVESAEFADGEFVLRGLRVRRESELTSGTLASLQAIFSDHFRIAAVRRGEELIVPNGMFQIQVGDVVYVVMRTDLLEKFLEVFRFKKRKTDRVIVFGGSGIAVDLCSKLEGRVHDVILLDPELSRVQHASFRLHNTSVVKGDALDEGLMQDLKIGDAEYFFGVGESEETNFSSALLAKRLGVGDAVMLTETPEHVELFDTLPVDGVVSPVLLSVGAILRTVRRGKVLSLFKLAGDRGEALELVAEKDAPAVDRMLREVKFPLGVMVAAVMNEKGPQVAAGGTMIRPGDRIIVVACKDRVDDAIRLFSN